MAFARIYGAQPTLLGGHVVSVETDIARGLFTFSVVGLPDKAVEEARDRVSAAIKNSGLESPKQKNHKVTISLAPAELKKEGAFFDLPIALSYLLARGEIHFSPEGKLFVGELALDGTVRAVRGILSITTQAQKYGISEIYVPAENTKEASLVDGISIYPVKKLSEILDHFSGNKLIESITRRNIDTKNTQSELGTQIEDVKGQEIAKRGLLIAAAGGHNIMLWGPPGTGKTMLAKAFQGILPPLSHDESLEVTAIHSYAGLLKDPVVHFPPYRAPHHTASYVSVIGGGSIPRPGEVTLAHRGVLFLDEFPEFDARVLESLRQPLEDGEVHISRSRGTERFPAKIMLVAAMNPCPCGFRGDQEKPCTCSPSSLEKYKRKVSGPIIDRIDIWIEVPRIPHRLLTSKTSSGEKGSQFRQRVQEARTLQRKRFHSLKKEYSTNSELSPKILGGITLKKEVEETLLTAAKSLGLSPRGFHRVIRVARTIADLAESPSIERDHILEALSYRPKSNLFS